jgi:hypothetical protein
MEQTILHKRRRRVWMAGLLCALLLVGSLWGVCAFAGGSLGYRAESADLTGGQQYFYNPISRRAYAAQYNWDGRAESMTIRIPDTVFGYPVTGLGGFMGRGVPCRFAVCLPESYGVKHQFDPELFEDERREHPNAQVVDLVFSVALGKNVSTVEAAGCDWAYCFDGDWTERICRIYYEFDCDPENETFYSEAGKLYTRADGALVPDFSYPEG